MCELLSLRPIVDPAVAGIVVADGTPVATFTSSRECVDAATPTGWRDRSALDDLRRYAPTFHAARQLWDGL